MARYLRKHRWRAFSCPAGPGRDTGHSTPSSQQAAGRTCHPHAVGPYPSAASDQKSRPPHRGSTSPHVPWLRELMSVTRMVPATTWPAETMMTWHWNWGTRRSRCT